MEVIIIFKEIIITEVLLILSNLQILVVLLNIH
jgi:hypothetical protein